MGGAESWFLGLFTWLAKNNINLNVYTTNARFFKNLSDFKPKKIPLVIDLIGDWKGFVKGLILLPAAIIYYGFLVFMARGQTDMLFLSGFIEKVLGSFWGRVFGIPVVWAEFGPYGDLLNHLGFLYRAVKHIPVAIVIPSRHSRDWLVNNLGLDPHKIVIIPCGIADPKITKTKLKWEACCVSRLESGKGQDLLIAAWAKVIEKIPGAKLQIVGEGDQYSNLKSQIANHKLENNIFLAGWVVNSLKIMAASKIICFPTQWPLEGFGLVAVEAAALSKPVIGYNFGPVPEIVSNKKTGILVKNGGIEGMAEAIIQLLTHPEMAVKIGMAARQRFLDHFVMEKIGPKYLQVFEQACTRKN